MVMPVPVVPMAVLVPPRDAVVTVVVRPVVTMPVIIAMAGRAVNAHDGRRAEGDGEVPVVVCPSDGERAVEVRSEGCGAGAKRQGCAEGDYVATFHVLFLAGPFDTDASLNAPARPAGDDRPQPGGFRESRGLDV